MKECRVGFTSAAERMKILEVVTGSNQRLIQLQTVGKKEGAPTICCALALKRKKYNNAVWIPGVREDVQKSYPKSPDNAP